MKHTRFSRAVPFAACAFTLASLPEAAHAGSYSTDFTTNPGLTVYQNAQSITAGNGWVASGGNPGGYLKMTDAANDQRTVVVFPDFEPGFLVGGFTFEVDCRIGAGTNPPADGFSINFARTNDPVLVNKNTTGFAANPDGALDNMEEGTTTGIGIGFDAYKGAGLTDVVGITIRVDGQLKHTVELPTIGVADTDPNYNQSLQTGASGAGVGALNWEKFKVELRMDGTIDVFWKDQKVIDNVQTDFTPTVGRLIFGARTGGLNQAHHFDNLSLTTVLAPLAGVTSSLDDGLFTFQVTDFGTESIVTPADFQFLAINGMDVTPDSITKTGNVTTVTYQSPTALALNTPQDYQIEFWDQEGISVYQTGSLQTQILPNESLLDVEPTLNLWNIREIRGATVDGAIPLNTAIAIAQNPPVQTDPPTPAIRIDNYTAPYFNLTDPQNTGPRGYFRRDTNISTNDYLAANADDNNIVAVGKTKIQVDETGIYTFWVQSDDGFALRVNGGEFINSAGTAGQLIDPADRSTLAFTLGTGNSNTRGSIQLTAGVEYVLDFLWFEGGSSAFAEVALAPGDHVADPITGKWKLVGGLNEIPYFPEAPLALPTPAGDRWAVRDYRNADGSTFGGTVRAAFALIANPGAAVITDATAPVVNFVDPNNAGARGIFTNDIPFPADTGVDDNNFATAATYQFTAEPGDYTFAVTSDDGFAMRLLGGPHLINTGGPGGVDPLDSRTFFNPGASGDHSFGTYRITEAGTYTLELVMYEGAGGASVEVAWAPGNFTARGATANWMLVGDSTDPVIPALVPVLPADLFALLPPAPAGQWSTRFTYSTTAITNLDPTAFAAIRNLANRHEFGNVPYLNFRNFIGVGQTENPYDAGLFNPNSATVAYREPAELQFIGATGLADNVGALASTRIVIPTTGTYTFGIISDDGFALRVVGATEGFSRVSGNAIIDPAQKNTVYRLTGSNNARAVINLEAGTYDLQFAYYEGGGGAHFEVYSALGNFTDDANSTAWRIIGATVSGGLALVEQTPPASGPITVGNLSFDAGTQQFGFSFSSTPGATYEVEYSTDLVNWEDVNASLPASDGATTAVTGNASDLAPAGPKPKLFFRLRAN